MLESIANKTYKTPISRDNGCTNECLSDNTESTLELFKCDNDQYFIEWDIPSLEMTEGIGIWCDEGTKNVSSYDGVFELSDIHIEFLKENGFTTDDVE